MAGKNNHKQNGAAADNGPTLIERLAERLGGSSTAKTVYGEPVERDGVTVIPVAKVRYGFGGGQAGKDAQDNASGGGGGTQVQPVGYIELKGGQSSFKPIRDLGSLAAIVLAGGFTGWLMLSALRRLTRGK